MSVAEAEALMYLSLLHCSIFGGLSIPIPNSPFPIPQTQTQTQTQTLTLPKAKLMCLSLDRAQ